MVGRASASWCTCQCSAQSCPQTRCLPTQADYARRQQFVALISAYALAIPKHLRETLTVQDLAMLSDAERACIQPAAHMPLAVMKLLLDKVQQLRTDNDISMEQFLALSQNLNELIDTLGGMERIKKNAYTLFVCYAHQAIYCSIHLLFAIWSDA